jgi:hypothetical protein
MRIIISTKRKIDADTLLLHHTLVESKLLASFLMLFQHTVLANVRNDLRTQSSLELSVDLSRNSTRNNI